MTHTDVQVTEHSPVELDLYQNPSIYFKNNMKSVELSPLNATSKSKHAYSWPASWITRLI